MKTFTAVFRDILSPALILVLSGIVAYDHFKPHEASSPSAAVDGNALGRKYAPTVCSTLGDAWGKAADMLESGHSVTESIGTLQAAWQEDRVSAFSKQVAPEFARVLPEGTEPADPAKRAEVVKLWREFSKGLKGGR